MQQVSRKDRRTRRSEETQQAVNYQLEYVRDNQGLGFLVVANEEGVFLAGTGDRTRNEILAAWATELACAEEDNRPRLEAELQQHLFGDETEAAVEVRPFSVSGMPMYLCAAGAPESQSDDALEHTINGVKRIFRTT